MVDWIFQKKPESIQRIFVHIIQEKMTETLALRMLNGDIVAEIPRVPRGGAPADAAEGEAPIFTAADVKSAYYELFGKFPSSQILVIENDPVDDDFVVLDTVEEATVLIIQKIEDDAVRLLNPSAELSFWPRLDHDFFHGTAPELLNDRDFALALLRKSQSWQLSGGNLDSLLLVAGSLMPEAGPKVRADHQCVTAAVSNSGHALEFAALPLKADREIVMAAVSNYGFALEHAALSLQADREIVMAAVCNWGPALKYAAPHLRADRELVLAAVQAPHESLVYHALHYAEPSLRADKDIICVAVSHVKFEEGGWRADYFIELARPEDRDFVRAAVNERKRLTRRRNNEDSGANDSGSE